MNSMNVELFRPGKILSSLFGILSLTGILNEPGPWLFSMYEKETSEFKRLNFKNNNSILNFSLF